MFYLIYLEIIFEPWVEGTFLSILIGCAKSAGGRTGLLGI